MKVSRKWLAIFAVPLILAAVSVWFLAERKKQVGPRSILDQRVQIFARAPQMPHIDLSRRMAVLSTLLIPLDGGLAAPAPQAQVQATDSGVTAAMLKGLVVDPSGNAPGACTLYLRPAKPGELAPHVDFTTAVTGGPDGVVAAQGVAPGAWDILAKCEKGLGRLRNVNVAAEGTSDFGTLRLDAGGVLRGTVMEAGTKKPIPSATVTLQSPWPNRSMPDAATVFSSFVDPDGRFEFEAVPEGKWNLRVQAQGYLAKDLQSLATAGRGSIDLQQIYLVRGNIETIRDNSQFGGIGISIGRRRDEVWSFLDFVDTWFMRPA